VYERLGVGLCVDVFAGLIDLLGVSGGVGAGQLCVVIAMSTYVDVVPKWLSLLPTLIASLLPTFVLE
jgi:ABC-type uncharacterized transport system permease subunit